MWLSYGLPESNHEEESDKPKLKDILQNKWPLILKNVKVMEVKEIWRSCSSLKETKETRQLFATCDSEQEEFIRDFLSFEIYLFIYSREVGSSRGRGRKSLKKSLPR